MHGLARWEPVRFKTLNARLKTARREARTEKKLQAQAAARGAETYLDREDLGVVEVGMHATAKAVRQGGTRTTPPATAPPAAPAAARAAPAAGGPAMPAAGATAATPQAGRAAMGVEATPITWKARPWADNEPGEAINLSQRAGGTVVACSFGRRVPCTLVGKVTVDNQGERLILDWPSSAVEARHVIGDAYEEESLPPKPDGVCRTILSALYVVCV